MHAYHMHDQPVGLGHGEIMHGVGFAYCTLLLDATLKLPGGMHPHPPPQRGRGEGRGVWRVAWRALRGVAQRCERRMACGVCFAVCDN